LPINLAVQLYKPLNPVIPMFHWQPVFFRGRTEQTVLKHRNNRWIPRHIRTRQILIEVHQAEFTFMTWLDVHLAVFELHTFEAVIDRILWFLPIGLLNNTSRQHSFTMNCVNVRGAFGADRRASLTRSGKRIKIRRDPIFQHLYKSTLNLTSAKFFCMPETVLLESLMILPGKYFYGAIMIDGAEHVVELHHTVKEAPGNVALQGLEEGINIDLMLHLLPRLRREVNMHKVIIAGETELAECKLFVTLHSLLL